MGCDVSIVVGYRAKQGDIWQGDRRDTYREAARDAIARAAELKGTVLGTRQTYGATRATNERDAGNTAAPHAQQIA